MNRLRDFLHQHPHRLRVTHVVSSNDVTQKHLLINALHILSRHAIAKRLGKAPVNIKRLKGRRNRTLARRRVHGCLVILFSGDIEKLIESIRCHIPRQVAATKRRLDLRAQHLCIASRYVCSTTRIDQTACEFFPTIDVLDLVKKEKALLVAQLTLDHENVVEVRQSELGESLVLEIDVDDPAPINTPRDQVLNKTIEERRLSSTAQTGYDIVGLGIKEISTMDDICVANNLMLVEDDAFQNLPIHHSPIRLLYSTNYIIIRLLYSTDIQ